MIDPVFNSSILVSEEKDASDLGILSKISKVVICSRISQNYRGKVDV